MSEIKKSLYHSEMSQMGPIKVTVMSDVLHSKHAGKPDYVTLKIDNFDRYYNVENESCAAFFAGRKGQTISIVAEGSREEASITLVGQPIGAPQPDRAPARQQAAERPAARPDTQQNRNRTPMGPTVGMAINNACANITAQGRPLDPAEVFEIASDLLRLSYHLEEGNLAPKFTERPFVQK